MENDNDRISQWLSSEELKKLKHCPKPCGEMGRQVGEEMNVHHRELRDWGFSHAEIRKNLTVLDVGCGGGDTVKTLASLCLQGRIYGIDYSDEMVKLSSENNAENISEGRVEIKKSSVSDLPFDDTFFDLVTAVETTYFWPDLQNDLREILRVMKKNAVFLMINETYMDDKFREKIEELKRLINLKCHTPDEYRKIFSDAGFSDIKINTLEEKNWITLIATK